MIGFSRKRYLSLLERAGQVGELLSEEHFDPVSEQLVVRTSQDVEPILDNNAELRNEGLSGDGYSPTRELRRVASIPNIVIHKWLQEGVNVYSDEDWPEVRRRLNDRNWAHLRTSVGRV